jgi:hypothetical protein
MTNTVQISCILNTNNPAAKLGFEAWVDDQQFINVEHVQAEQPILIDLPDDEADHELKFILKNKNIENTKIDDSGNIVEDSTLTLKDLAFDEMKLGHMFTELAVYTHNFNGTGSETQQQFFGEMGCNGTVSLKFSTPIYLWLLEHM